MTQENIFAPPFAYIGTHWWKLQAKRFQNFRFLQISTGSKSELFWGGRKSKNAKHVQKVHFSAKFRFPFFSPKLSSGVPWTTCDHKKNVSGMFRGRKSIFKTVQNSVFKIRAYYRGIFDPWNMSFRKSRLSRVGVILEKILTSNVTPKKKNPRKRFC